MQNVLGAEHLKIQTHVLKCKDPRAEIVYITVLQKLDAHMRNIHTAPEI
jgi:hypothetical protein